MWASARVSLSGATTGFRQQAKAIYLESDHTDIIIGPDGLKGLVAYAGGGLASSARRSRRCHGDYQRGGSLMIRLNLLVFICDRMFSSPQRRLRSPFSSLASRRTSAL